MKGFVRGQLERFLGSPATPLSPVLGRSMERRRPWLGVKDVADTKLVSPPLSLLFTVPGYAYAVA
jgi:hypothetical protein